MLKMYNVTFKKDTDKKSLNDFYLTLNELQGVTNKNGFDFSVKFTDLLVMDKSLHYIQSRSILTLKVLKSTTFGTI